jgi:hypothetical protein
MRAALERDPERRASIGELLAHPFIALTLGRARPAGERASGEHACKRESEGGCADGGARDGCVNVSIAKSGRVKAAAAAATSGGGL